MIVLNQNCGIFKSNAKYRYRAEKTTSKNKYVEEKQILYVNLYLLQKLKLQYCQMIISSICKYFLYTIMVFMIHLIHTCVIGTIYILAFATHLNTLLFTRACHYICSVYLLTEIG